MISISDRDTQITRIIGKLKDGLSLLPSPWLKFLTHEDIYEHDKWLVKKYIEDAEELFKEVRNKDMSLDMRNLIILEYNLERISQKQIMNQVLWKELSNEEKHNAVTTMQKVWKDLCTALRWLYIFSFWPIKITQWASQLTSLSFGNWKIFINDDKNFKKTRSSYVTFRIDEEKKKGKSNILSVYQTEFGIGIRILYALVEFCNNTDQEQIVFNFNDIEYLYNNVYNEINRTLVKSASLPKKSFKTYITHTKSVIRRLNSLIKTKIEWMALCIPNKSRWENKDWYTLIYWLKK